MDQMLNDLFEAIKKDRKALIRLKHAVVSAKQFELAAKIREIEQKAFPETKEVKNAKAQALEINTVLRMVDLDVPQGVCWLISETLKQHSKKGGKFSIHDAVKLRLKKEEIFLDDKL